MANSYHILLLCALVAMICTPVLAQTSLIGIGVRGGGQVYLPSAAPGSTGEVSGNVGGLGAIDLRYTFYSCLNDRLGLGCAVGAGIGYGSTALKGSRTDQYTNVDYLNNRIDYTVDARYRQEEKFAQANASLLFALCYGKWTVNVGPRFMMPIAAATNLTIEEAHINAYYPTYDVHVADKMITGVLATPYTQTASSHMPEYSILMGAEAGYEWYVTDKTCIGVQLFADVAVWSKQSTMGKTQSPLIAVSAITNAANPTPSVTVHEIGQIAAMRYVDFGLRAYVAFPVGKAHSKESRADSRRDTKKHRNRYLWW